MTRALPINRLPKPMLSLTTVRWITEIPDPEDSSIVDDVEMFTVVGEQYRLDIVEEAISKLGESTGFLPPRFWLIHDNENTHDSLAVAVYAMTDSEGFHIGFLPKEQARTFRAAMQSLGREGQSLEVLGCITQGKSSPHPNGRIYLPVNFADLCQRGYAEDSANQVAWLKDQSPVQSRLGNDPSKDFSFDELCKIYCWYAKKRRWFCFPDECESNAEGIRSVGSGLPRADFAPFLTATSNELPVAVPTPRAEMIASSLPPTSQWYCLRKGVEAGPFTSDQLRSEARAGRIEPSDQVRRGDLAKWVPASRVKGLFADGVAAVKDKANNHAQSVSAQSINSLLVDNDDLPAPWSAGEVSDAVPNMFDELPAAAQKGSVALLYQGKKNGFATALVYADVDLAKVACKALCEGLGENFGMVARLGDDARFQYMFKEMPPQLKLPPVVSSEVVFRRRSIVVHIRMLDSQPEAVVAYAVRIDNRTGRFS
jgi:hypothetical protein